jgi:ATP-dependent exoDNAse (exonuclease V) beta subunit
LRFVLDQARAWSDTEHGGLRGYLAWALRQAQDGSRVAEAVLPETDLDAVRIMTIHAAKGLEFPVVILSGMSSRPRGLRGVKLLWPSAGGYSIRLNKSVQTNDFEVNQPLDEQMDEFERRRLLYVAATRARDHLVVSLHRAGKTPSSARLLVDAGAITATGVTAFETGLEQTAETAEAAIIAEPPPWDEWHPVVTAAQAASRKVSSISASGLEGTDPDAVFGTGPMRAAGSEPAPGFGPASQPSLFDVVDSEEVLGPVTPDPIVVPPGAAKGPRDVELPPWSKGRYGTAVGRAVHGVLQAVDLATEDGLEPLIAAQCAAEGVVPYSDVVLGCVRSALASDVVRRAAVRQHWKESFIGRINDDGTVLEGFIDLMYREDDGSTVIVDYKTDDIPDAAVGVRAEYYRPQIKAYLSCAQAAGLTDPVGVLLFLHPATQARARSVK